MIKQNSFQERKFKSSGSCFRLDFNRGSVWVSIETLSLLLYIRSRALFQYVLGGDPVSTGELKQGLHARGAVGPLKNGFYIIANDYDVAVAA